MAARDSARTGGPSAAAPYRLTAPRRPLTARVTRDASGTELRASSVALALA